MEIERKYLVAALPEDIRDFPFSDLEQVYLSKEPVIRLRRSEDRYELTVKGAGLLAREELNLPLTEEQYEHLCTKKEGAPIRKRRYRIPCGEYMIELDVFHGKQEGLLLAEVEFPTLEEAEAFLPPEWFGEEVTYDPRYQNVSLAYGF
ncbi:MAG: CYTH domain-containing protein [Lachnospiraceae bacterium]|nr:CYTH domain-containing protein [Lachnospiraceae bacterium]